MEEEANSFEHTPTWIVALVVFVIILLSLAAERGLHKLGKFLKHKDQDALFKALQKLKEELMLLGFISLLLTVFQGVILHMCIPPQLTNYMLPCKKKARETHISKHFFHGGIMVNTRILLDSEAATEHCRSKGKVPLLSLEALHQLHIFIFVMAVFHVIFCATTMVLGGARVREWKYWEDSIRREIDNPELADIRVKKIHSHHHRMFFQGRVFGHWSKATVVSWMMSFFKQFYGAVTKSDYITLREGFISNHCSTNSRFNFHKYLMRTLEYDYQKVVGISWYLWLFVVLFLLLNIEGWHSYFWLSFLPLVLLLLVGAKLEHIITVLAQELAQIAEKKKARENEVLRVKPSDELFWFHNPVIVLHLIHFILFQNAFEIGFFFWILFTYGFDSCIMERLGYIIPRLVIGVLVQVLCSYSTLPLYTIVTQMGSKFKPSVFDGMTHTLIQDWYEGHKGKSDPSISGLSVRKLDREPFQNHPTAVQEMAILGGTAINIHN